jgi:hypothetical protein
MISKHIDIWAVLLLLFGFALFTRTDEFVARVARHRMSFSHKVYPVSVRVVPFRLNRYRPAPSAPAVQRCREI